MKTQNIMLGAIFVALIGCGGGGGSSTTNTPSIQLSYEPTSVVETYPQGDPTPITIHVVGTNLPNEAVQITVNETQQVIKDGRINITQTSNSTFDATLTPSADLTQGTYSGNLIINIAKVSAPNIPLTISSNIIPYNFTVTQGTIITATIDGTPVTGFAGIQNQPFGNFSGLTARGNQVVDLISSVPVNWQTGIYVSGGTPGYSLISTSPTEWKATITNDGNAAFAGYIGITATAIGAPTKVITFDINVVYP